MTRMKIDVKVVCIVFYAARSCGYYKSREEVLKHTSVTRSQIKICMNKCLDLLPYQAKNCPAIVIKTVSRTLRITSRMEEAVQKTYQNIRNLSLCESRKPCTIAYVCFVLVANALLERGEIDEGGFDGLLRHLPELTSC